MDLYRPSLPRVVGNEGVGRVLAIGRGVDHLNVGDVLVPLYVVAYLVGPEIANTRKEPRLVVDK